MVQVSGKCLACGWSCLFVGTGGHVTCSISDCPDPGAAHKPLAAAPAGDPRMAQIRDLLAVWAGESSKIGAAYAIASAAAAGKSVSPREPCACEREEVTP
jgi:hypothetical protein